MHSNRKQYNHNRLYKYIIYIYWRSAANETLLYINDTDRVNARIATGTAVFVCQYGTFCMVRKGKDSFHVMSLDLLQHLICRK